MSSNRLSAERAKALEALDKHSFLKEKHSLRKDQNSTRQILNNIENLNNETSTTSESFVNKFKSFDFSKLNFENDEICGRSTSLQNSNSTGASSIQKPLNSARPSVDQMFATSICNNLNLEDEEFQDAGLMYSRLMRDEISYFDKYGDIPKTGRTQNTDDSKWEENVNQFQTTIGDYFATEHNSLLKNLRSSPTSSGEMFALFEETKENSVLDNQTSKDTSVSLTELMKKLKLDSNMVLEKSNSKQHITYVAEKENVAPKEKLAISSTRCSRTIDKVPKISIAECDVDFDKEYEEFLGSPLLKNRIRKRSKSRSKSPNLLRSSDDHLSSTRIETPIDSERFYNNSSPSNFGKMSLPTYELASGSHKRGSPNSSLFSHRDGKKLPLKIDKFSIAWGSVKLRRQEKQTVQIKNVSHKRLQFKINVKGPGFDILNIQGNLITIQAMECRTIELSFCPTVLGIAVGQLTFGSPNNADIPEIPIHLCGFGGHISLHHSFGVTASPIGLPFINLGLLTDLNETVRPTFSINNKGTTHAFFAILLDQVGMDLPGICDSISVKPKTGVIPPMGEMKVVISYKASRNDVKRIFSKIKNKNALAIANLQILHGVEATRIRIKRMIPEIRKTKELPNSIEFMWNIPETPSVIQPNLVLKESVESVYELISTLKTRDISLTICNHNWDIEDQSTIVIPDVDETILFKTIIENE